MRIKVVACGVFEPELTELAPQVENEIDLHFLDAGLHEQPDSLRSQLQQAIDEAEGQGYDAIVAGYGLCGRGTSGIVARSIPVVLLRVHDCITLFLGSRAAYREQFSKHPGTFYITPGWYNKKIGAGTDAPMDEQARRDVEDDPRLGEWAERFGEDAAAYILHFHDSWKRNYTRAAYIDTVRDAPEDYELYARRLAESMGWKYERLPGDCGILQRALQGNWDAEDILVLQPGQRSAITGDDRLLTAIDPGEPLAHHKAPHSEPRTELLTSQPAGIVALGIDAGGTYTDAVVYDFSADRVIAKAKALTTRHDLIIGIQAALDQLEPLPAEQVAMVALSTTLATNSIVEDKGGRPGVLIMAPFDPPAGAINWPSLRKIRGQMTISGRELQPPDPAEVSQAVRDLLAEGVDAFVVSGYAGVRNPEHENTVQQLIERECDLPVICGHHLSTRLDYTTRANTAILNGRLLAVINQLIVAVKAALRRRNIRAPLMIVKGDGSLINEAVALQRPVETVLSGPAASMVGARFLTGVKDALVFDMGGTTTDAATITGGLPKIHPQGASINGWRTAVEAADIVTIGLGGDSHLDFNAERRLLVGPRRVVPLCYLAAFYEPARTQLMALDPLSIVDPTSARALDFFVFVTTPPDRTKLSERDAAALDALRDGPLSRTALARRLDLQSPQLLRIGELESAGYIQRSALTPTDILHVTGEFVAWDVPAAAHGLRIFAELYGEDQRAVIDAVREQIVRRLCMQVLTCAYGLPPYDITGPDCPLCTRLLDAALSQSDGNPIHVSLKYLQDLVAIGAPVRPFFPEVAKRLGANLIIPDHAEVANAIGAAASEVVMHETVTVRPGELGNFVVHSRNQRNEYLKLEDAIAAAEALAEQLAAQRAIAAGAARPDTRTEVNKREVRIADGTVQLVEVTVEAIAAGRPTLAPSTQQVLNARPDGFSPHVE